MIPSKLLSLAAVALAAQLASATADQVIAPKVVIVNLFAPEAEAWYHRKGFPDLLTQNITLPGLSPLFPEVHCTGDGQVCQAVTGEGEINAAATVAALSLSPKFDLRKSYFLVAGIAGVNPERATLGGVAFARYTVAVAMQHEIDVRELSKNFSTGYIPYGAHAESQYPEDIYGSEVFELNDNLRQRALSFAQTAKLADSKEAQQYRAKYAPVPAYKAGSSHPSVVACDIATSDVYYSGALLGEAFGNFTTLITNGTGRYCMTAQEDNAVLEPLVRAAVSKLIDFSRVIVMRTGSDFDRQHPGQQAVQNLFMPDQGASQTSLTNLFRAGSKVVEGIVNQWNQTFERGIKPSNYIGDIYNSLGGTPDFGLPSFYVENQRSIKHRRTTTRRNT